MKIRKFFVRDKKKLLFIFLCGILTVIFISTLGEAALRRREEIQLLESFAEYLSFSTEDEKDIYRTMDQMAARYADDNVYYAIAVYDPSSDIVYKMQNILFYTDEDGKEYMVNADEQFSEEVLRTIAGYGTSFITDDTLSQGIYRYYVYVNSAGKVNGLAAAETIWRDNSNTGEETIRDPYTGELLDNGYVYQNTYYSGMRCVSFETVYSWGTKEGNVYSAELYFPYAGSGIWEKWYADAFLQEETASFNADFEMTGNTLSVENLNDTDGDFLHDSLKVSLADGTIVMIAGASDILAGIWSRLLQWCFIFAAYVLTGYFYRKTTDHIQAEKQEISRLRKDSVNVLAHELRTPLSAIMGYAENIKYGVREEKKEEYLDKILAKGKEMDEMIEEMLALSRLEDEKLALVKQEISINELIRKIRGDFDPADIKVEEDAQMIINADSFYIEKTLCCLIDNAVRYKREGSEVFVTIRQDRVEIYDECDPIPAEQMEKLYAFTPSAEGRLGFGLYFAKKAADKNGLGLVVEYTDGGVRAVLKK